MAREGSVAPRERINIKYIPATGDQKAEIELPLRMLVAGDFKGHREDDRLEERETVRVDKSTFDSVMKKAGLSLEVNVNNYLSDTPEEESILPVALQIESLRDFEPDSIAKQVPELNKLLELREALVALKGPLGSAPKFRKKLQQLLENQASRSKLEDEINQLLNTDSQEISTKKPKTDSQKESTEKADQ
jgi:type VI secretion system protein ImpB